jgi:hypothetical protein
VQVRYVADETVESAEDAYRVAFGPDADTTDLHAGMLPGMLASLLGFQEREIHIDG